MVAPIVPPTGVEFRDAWREDHPDIHLVHEETKPDDHGYGYYRTFKRESDQTYWRVHGVNQGGGAYDSLRDDPMSTTVIRVWPHQIIRTVYRPTPTLE